MSKPYDFYEELQRILEKQLLSDKTTALQIVTAVAEGRDSIEVDGILGQKFIVNLLHNHKN